VQLIELLAEKLPSGQLKHMVAPVLFEKKPALHTKQVAAAASENLPGVQEVQVVLAEVLEALPASH
jgi:hypothetical protein